MAGAGAGIIPEDAADIKAAKPLWRGGSRWGSALFVACTGRTWGSGPRVGKGGRPMRVSVGTAALCAIGGMRLGRGSRGVCREADNQEALQAFDRLRHGD